MQLEYAEATSSTCRSSTSSAYRNMSRGDAAPKLQRLGTASGIGRSARSASPSRGRARSARPLFEAGTLSKATPFRKTGPGSTSSSSLPYDETPDQVPRAGGDQG